MLRLGGPPDVVGPTVGVDVDDERPLGQIPNHFFHLETAELTAAFRVRATTDQSDQRVSSASSYASSSSSSSH